MKTPESVSKLLGIVLRHQEQRLINPGQKQYDLETYPELKDAFTEVFGYTPIDSTRYLIAPNGYLWYLKVDIRGNLSVYFDYDLQYAIAMDRRSGDDRRASSDRRA